MFGITDFPLFALSAALLVAAPGPDFVYVTTRGIAQGRTAGGLSALGISTGLLVHTLFAALGLSALIQASRTAYLLIKYAGAAYLIYLGLRTLLSRKRLLDPEKPVAMSRSSAVFRQGVLTNVFNPKAILTFLAFIPQFVDAGASNPVPQFLVLGITIAAIAAVWFGFVGYFAGIIGARLQRSPTMQRILTTASGAVLVLLGVRLLLER